MPSQVFYLNIGTILLYAIFVSFMFIINHIAYTVNVNKVVYFKYYYIYSLSNLIFQGTIFNSFAVGKILLFLILINNRTYSIGSSWYYAHSVSIICTTHK